MTNHCAECGSKDIEYRGYGTWYCNDCDSYVEIIESTKGLPVIINTAVLIITAALIQFFSFSGGLLFG